MYFRKLVLQASASIVLEVVSDMAASHIEVTMSSLSGTIDMDVRLQPELGIDCSHWWQYDFDCLLFLDWQRLIPLLDLEPNRKLHLCLYHSPPLLVNLANLTIISYCCMNFSLLQMLQSFLLPLAAATSLFVSCLPHGICQVRVNVHIFPDVNYIWPSMKWCILKYCLSIVFTATGCLK